MTGNAQAAKDDGRRAAAKAAQGQKADWIKAVLADPSLSSAAARVGAAAAFNRAYTKGAICATYKHIGELSGEKYRTVRRAAAELAEKNYWNIDHNSGGANLYTLIPSDERGKLWDTAAEAWRNECNKWDAAKQKWE